MKALIELVELITKHKKKRIEVLGRDDDPNNRYNVFYNLIASGEVKSDDEAARYFFGEDKDSSFTQYRNLRNNLFRRLVNSAFFIDLKKPMFNEAQAAVHNVRKQAAAARIVGSRGAAHSAMEIAEKTIKAAKEYELVYELIDLARLLRHKYVFIEPDRNKREYYEKLIDTSLSDLRYIVKAEKMYYELIEPLNDIPIFSKDKRGLNIPVLIAHAIMLLQLKRYDEAYDRMLALDKYAGRHLKAGDATFRSYCFIKALLCIHHADYEKEAAQSAASEFLAQMSESPLQLVHTPHEIEVIPYEHLWDMAMESISG